MPLDLIIQRDAFTAAKSGDNGVNFENFIKGYEEVINLYDSMGTIFQFASKDMRSRVKGLNTLTKENPEVYVEVGKALDYEKAQGIKKKTKAGAKSASKVLMEMFWDVVFFINIFQKLEQAQDDSKMSLISRKAFDETIAPHANLALRTAARLAIKTLPSRKDYVDKYVKQDTAEALTLVPAVLAPLKAIHAIMEAALVRNDLMKEAQAEAEQNKKEDAAAEKIDP